MGPSFVFFLFPMCSHRVFKGFSFKFPNVFPIAPHFHPIYALAKVVLLSYIKAIKGARREAPLFF